MNQSKTIIHPLAIVDILKEFQDIKKKKFSGKKIGSLLGYYKKKKNFVTSSFRIPFKQKMEKNWFLDQVFMEKMAAMFKKINSREKIIGWYALKKKLNSSESRIHRIFFGYTHRPIFLHLWVSKEINGLIIDIFTEKQKNIKGGKFLKTMAVEIGMLESEEVAIHQILSNSKTSPYLNSLDITKKWQCSIIFFIKYIQKVIKNQKNKKSILESQLFELKFVEKFVTLNKNYENNNFFHIEKRLLILYISSILRLITSIENFAFFSLNKYLR
ncbi:prsS12 (nucleomorph) [Hemiselmis andersenii]|uniref:PrsS12 n=1 Tax=Hemiselmis andersenii TaxID=464988 RepID=A9BL70_HEMAN|nr:prsS12 [Hemiselmis andersenii]ABW98253.1 prsS12 [Hemiselmis andersenii]|mmetsp:Transcript_61787/g.148687  ORF Transcript_61787/g.148687 Transcript_61787/m.148687 type:complete len:271 (+) Transcript_61787:3071-3883(+)